MQGNDQIEWDIPGKKTDDLPETPEIQNDTVQTEIQTGQILRVHVLSDSKNGQDIDAPGVEGPRIFADKLSKLELGIEILSVGHSGNKNKEQRRTYSQQSPNEEYKTNHLLHFQS